MKTSIGFLCALGAAAMLGSTQSASACYVELRWAAESKGKTAVLVADYQYSDPVTSTTYKPLDPSVPVYALNFYLVDTPTDAQLANLDLMATLQQEQRLLQMLSDISKQLSDAAMRIVRNIGGASAVDVADGPGPSSVVSEYSLEITSSFPGFETIVLPLDCQGDCGGLYAANWAFDKYVSEPGALPLASAALLIASVAGLGRRTSRRGAEASSGSASEGAST
ncbi:MAG: hypothetical protein U1F50_00115 [Rubrivivax sp.]